MERERELLAKARQRLGLVTHKLPPAERPITLSFSPQELMDLSHSLAVAEGHAIRASASVLNPFAVAVQEVRAQRLSVLFDRFADALDGTAGSEPAGALRIVGKEAGRG